MPSTPSRSNGARSYRTNDCTFVESVHSIRDGSTVGDERPAHLMIYVDHTDSDKCIPAQFARLLLQGCERTLVTEAIFDEDR
jgi:hypothetical protein